MCGQVPDKEVEYEMLLIFQSLKDYLEHVSAQSLLRCSKCHQRTCIACRQLYTEVESASATTNPSLKAADKLDGTTEGEVPLAAQLLHCPQIQAVCLTVGLAHVEEVLKADPAHLSPGARKRGRPAGTEANGETAAKKASVTTAAGTTSVTGKWQTSGWAAIAQANTLASFSIPTEPLASLDDDDVDDYEYDAMYPMFLTTSETSTRDNGTGFAGSYSSSEHSWTRSSSSRQQAQDERLREALSQIRPFVPDVHRQPCAVQSDFMPHITSIAAVRRRFLPVACTLLRTERRVVCVACRKRSCLTNVSSGHVVA